MFAVFVTFKIVPGKLDAFLPLMEKQARNSMNLERACRVFEIWVKEDSDDVVQLYEIYDDAAAFDLHLASDHFKSFDAAVASMLVEKTILTFDRKL